MKSKISNILLIAFLVIMVLLSYQNALAEVNDIYIDRFDIFSVDTISVDANAPENIQVEVDVFNEVFFDPSSPNDAFVVNLAPGAQNVRLASGNLNRNVEDICTVSGDTVSCAELQQCFPIFGCIDKDISRIFIFYDLVLDITAAQQGDITSFSLPYETGGTGAGSFSRYSLRLDWGPSGLPLSFVSTVGPVSYLDEANGSVSIVPVSYPPNFNYSELLTLELQTPIIEIVEINDPLSGSIYPQSGAGTVDSNPINLTIRIQPVNGENITGDLSILDTTLQTEELRYTEQGLEVSEITEINISLPSAGEAWDDSGNAVENREMVARFTLDSGETFASFEASYPIKPRPVILVHGLWSDAETWGAYATFLSSLHPGWKAYAVGDGNARGTMDTGMISEPNHLSNTIAGNAKELQIYIDEVMAQEGANQVDIVAHSMGGLISRYYIQNLMGFRSNKPTVYRLLMLGTPNGGSDCAAWITGLSPLLYFPAMFELRPDYLTFFIDRIVDRNGVEFSILAGDNYENPCSLPEGDGVVSVASALAIPIPDSDSRTDSFHTGMTGSQEDFTQFVKPRLTQIPPHPMRVNGGDSLFKQYGTVIPEHSILSYTEMAELMPGQTYEILLPQIGGTRLNILLTNMLQMNARLLNPGGDVVATIDGADPNNEIFAAMADDNLVLGAYTLELTNVGTEPQTTIVSTWVDNDPITLELAVTDISANSKSVSVTFKNDGQAITNATVAVQVINEAGLETTFNLYDDGMHNDGIANDGIYRNSFNPSASEYHLIHVQADGDGLMRATSQIVFEFTGGNSNSDKLYLPFVIRN